MMREFTSRPDGDEDFNPVAGVSFKLDGETFECSGRPSALETSILASAASADAGVADGYSAASVGAISDFIRMALGDAEFNRFRAHCRAHDTDDHVLLDVMDHIRVSIEKNVEADTARPTGPPNRSSSGPRSATDARSSTIIGLASGDVTVITDVPASDPALSAEREAQEAMRRAAKGSRGRQQPRRSAGSRVSRAG